MTQENIVQLKTFMLHLLILVVKWWLYCAKWYSVCVCHIQGDKVEIRDVIT